MSDYNCPCGFGLRVEIAGPDAVPFDVETYSAEWHRMHESHHLAAFPDVDRGTRDNLRSFVQRAEIRELSPSHTRLLKALTQLPLYRVDHL